MEFFDLWGLITPIFWIIGLVAVIMWLARGGRSSEAQARLAAAKLVRDSAANQPSEVAQALEKVAAELEAPGTYSTTPVSSNILPYTEANQTPPPPPSTQPAWMSTDIRTVFQSLDNINIILYLGAFLVVVSAGIFVGYNFSVLSGVFKTVFLALFALAFYAVGLILFLYHKKLRPAGVTFTAIGLILLPLVGLAAYNFTALHQYRSFTWLATSAITLIVYAFTITRTRQTYIAYLMAFTTLSLFEACISVFYLPLHWFGWGMAVVSITLLAISRAENVWEDASSALMISANIFMPLSLAFSLSLAGENGAGQLGITLGLSGAFYAAMAKRFAGRPAANWYFGAALVSLPLALMVGLWDTLPHLTLAAIVLAVCAAYLAAGHIYATRLSRTQEVILSGITGILPLAGLLLASHRPGAVLAILIAAVLINAEMTLRLHLTGHALISALSFLAVPFVLCRLVADPVWPWELVSVLMFAETLALVWWARRIRYLDASGPAVGVFGYSTALIMAVGAAAIPSSTSLFWGALAGALGFYLISVYERQAGFVFLAGIAFYVALFQPAIIFDSNLSVTAVLLLLGGGAVYGLGHVDADAERAKALRYTGVCGPFLGACLGFSDGLDHVEPVLALAGGGGLLYAEADREDQPVLKEVAGAIVIVAFNWFCAVYDVTQVQAYTLPWAAYMAFLGYRRRAGGHAAYDVWVALALAILTFPLAGQALASDGQLYGLLLIIEALALVITGMALSYRLVTIWGIATLVIEVLYQMRDILFALPKYFISAALGLGLLAAAIVMLQRRKGND
jgi:hypothetical protein